MGPVLAALAKPTCKPTPGRAVLITESAPSSFAQSSEFCLCHRELFKGLSKHNREIAFEAHFGKGVKNCPMAGRIVPEMTGGLLNDLFDELWTVNERELLDADVPH
eukprot:4194448-Pyramimonas_sp.AAC.1